MLGQEEILQGIQGELLPVQVMIAQLARRICQANLRRELLCILIFAVSNIGAEGIIASQGMNSEIFTSLCHDCTTVRTDSQS